MTEPFFDADDPAKPDPPTVPDPDEVEDHEKCECGCCHMPDYGACGSYTEGANGRCVYCDHGKQCHTDANPETHNTPL